VIPPAGSPSSRATRTWWRYLRHARNWGRWGGTTRWGPEPGHGRKRRRAAALVRTGEIVSLSRPFPLERAPNNPTPAERRTTTVERGPTAGSAVDYLWINTHGTASTHLDALCHVWDRDGMWNGRDPAQEVTADGVRFGGVEPSPPGSSPAAFSSTCRGTEACLRDPGPAGHRAELWRSPATGTDVSPATGRRPLGPGALGRGEPCLGHRSLDVGSSRGPASVCASRSPERRRGALGVGHDGRAAQRLRRGVRGPCSDLGLRRGLIDNALVEPLARICARRRWEFQPASRRFRSRGPPARLMNRSRSCSRTSRKRVLRSRRYAAIARDLAATVAVTR
jgi:hypothetical protein